MSKRLALFRKVEKDDRRQVARQSSTGLARAFRRSRRHTQRQAQGVCGRRGKPAWAAPEGVATGSRAFARRRSFMLSGLTSGREREFSALERIPPATRPPACRSKQHRHGSPPAELVRASTACFFEQFLGNSVVCSERLSRAEDRFGEAG